MWCYVGGMLFWFARIAVRRVSIKDQNARVYWFAEMLKFFCSFGVGIIMDFYVRQ